MRNKSTIKAKVKREPHENIYELGETGVGEVKFVR